MGGQVEVTRSSLRFVYPFLFERDTFERSLEAIGRAAWSGPSQSLTVWEKEVLPIHDMLPQVAEFLQAPPDKPSTAGLFKMTDAALRSAGGLCAGAGRAGAEWRLTSRRISVAFTMDGVQLAIFRTGVGFLILSAKPSSDQLGDWLDFLHHFRFISGSRSCSVKAVRRVGGGGNQRPPEEVPFFPEPGGGTARHPDGVGTLGDLVDGLMSSATDRNTGIKWWDEVFVPGQMIPFATLFVSGVPDEGSGDLLYRIRNFFHSRQDIAPAQSDLSPEHPSLLPYSDRQWFFFSLDGGGFVASAAPDTPFFRETLPGHLNRQYFLLFVLALQQRFTLMMISAEVARHWPHAVPQTGEQSRRRQLAGIRDVVLAFTAQGYFAQVMQQEHHHRCYLKWQDTFQVARLYQEVSAEVAEMHRYLDERLQQRIEASNRQQEYRFRRLDRIAWIIGLPGLVFIFFGALPGFEKLSVTTVAVTLVAGALAAAVGWLASRAMVGDKGDDQPSADIRMQW